VEAARVLSEPGRGAEDLEGEEHGTQAGIDDHEEACSEAVEQLSRGINHMVREGERPRLSTKDHAGGQ